MSHTTFGVSNVARTPRTFPFGARKSKFLPFYRTAPSNSFLLTMFRRETTRDYPVHMIHCSIIYSICPPTHAAPPPLHSVSHGRTFMHTDPCPIRFSWNRRMDSGVSSDGDGRSQVPSIAQCAQNAQQIKQGLRAQEVGHVRLNLWKVFLLELGLVLVSSHPLFYLLSNAKQQVDTAAAAKPLPNERFPG